MSANFKSSQCKSPKKKQNFDKFVHGKDLSELINSNHAAISEIKLRALIPSHVWYFFTRVLYFHTCTRALNSVKVMRGVLLFVRRCCKYS